jgi:hypothetical protein
MWVKGQCGNPKGRPKGSSTTIKQFREALKNVEAKQGKTLLQHAIEQAYKDHTVLIAMVKKILPDLTEGYIEEVIKHEEHVVKVTEVINDIVTRIERHKADAQVTEPTTTN